MNILSLIYLNKVVSWLHYPSSCTSPITFVLQSSVNWLKITRAASFLAAIPHRTTCFELFFIIYCLLLCIMSISIMTRLRSSSITSQPFRWMVGRSRLDSPLRATCRTSTFLAEPISVTFLRTSFEYEQPRGCLWNESMSLKPKEEVSREMPSTSTSMTARFWPCSLDIV